jgi:hypothetical protein
LSPKKPSKPAPTPPELDGPAILRSVLGKTEADIAEAKAAWETRAAKAAQTSGRQPKAFKRDLHFSIKFAKHVGAAMADGLRPDFPEIRSGENLSRAVSGAKRVDVNYSTSQAGLGFAISLKSVHRGEEDRGNADFIHNMKRNDEELRVESTNHHLRQPYAVLVAVMFLPFESCHDLTPVSSFGSFVEYFWRLKGRDEPEDAPDLFELVFIALYARSGSELGFYQVGGDTRCPRVGQPKKLLTFAEFLALIKKTYDLRNGKDFFFEDEDPDR